LRRRFIAPIISQVPNNQDHNSAEDLHLKLLAKLHS
jgi:hypothetical protein